MNSKDASNDEIVDDFEIDEMTPSVDDFIKELEAKEKTLDISSDLVIEIGDSDVEHDNIHDSFVPTINREATNFGNSSSFAKNELKSKEKISQLQDKVTMLTSERNELKDSLQRRQRDFDNYRNRIERERNETFTNILSNLATKMLPVIDNLDRALDSTDDSESAYGEKDFKTFIEGIVLVNQQLNEVLIEMGVQLIPSVGKPFDPNFHEAVASEETDEYPHRTVIQELLRGYKIDDRIIRASMVKVSSSADSQSSKSVESE